MEPSPNMIAMVAVGIAVAISGLCGWAVLIIRKFLAPNAAIIPWTPRRQVPWALIDLILLVGLWILASVLVRQILQNWGMLPREIKVDELTIEQNKAVLIGNIVASLVILMNALVLIAFRTGASMRDFGITLTEMLPDLKLGLLGFILLAPPVYALQGVLVHVWKPSKHPLVEMFKESPDASFFVIVFVSAAIIAPLSEEIIFRVLLQGFLEKWFTFSTGLYELLIGGQPRHLAPIEMEHEENAQPELAAEAAPLVADSNPYAPPADTQLPARGGLTGHAANSDELRGPQAWLPIAISSTIFALLHLPHGPDWIPLLFLATGLGYLYQRTHRLLPSLTVHFLLNAYSLWGLWLQVNN